MIWGAHRNFEVNLSRQELMSSFISLLYNPTTETLSSPFGIVAFFILLTSHLLSGFQGIMIFGISQEVPFVMPT